MSDQTRNLSQKCRVVKPPPAPSTALVAVALQDHLVKQYSLSPSAPVRKRRLQVHVSPFPKTAGCRNCGKQPHHSYYDKQNQKRTTVLHINSDMLALNTNSDGRETVRPAGLFQPVNPRVPPSSEEVEHVLEGVQPPLTLAQRMGLVDAPPELLCSEEWARLKAMSNQRQDSALPCPICHEPFGLNQQVLLSCSHVFHLSCLQSLERFSRCKRCPMCRTENYQKRIIYEGAHCYKNWAAIVIQSLWRGYVVRKWYQSYREKCPPKHPSLRRKHFEQQLERLTETMLKSCAQRSSGAECVMAESDRAVEVVRQAIRMLEHTVADSASSENWSRAYSKAEDHAMSECPVCLVSLHPLDLTHQPRPISILSCGHLFHVKCIESLEWHWQGQHTVNLCPLCRTPYLRQLYYVQSNN